MFRKDGGYKHWKYIKVAESKRIERKKKLPLQQKLIPASMLKVCNQARKAATGLGQ